MASRLLLWAQANGRQFAWREWRDPYRLLVTEILLRQTRAFTVAGFVDAFYRSYPDADALAVAREEELADNLKVLGLSLQRARHLRALASRLVELGDECPRDLVGLTLLPGIGRYSAGLVASIGGEPAAAVDTNVARVVCRVFDVEPSHAEARKSANIWRIATELVTTSAEPARTTWAILDLAAALCKIRVPLCDACPLEHVCLSHLKSSSPEADPPPTTRRHRRVLKV